MATWAHGDVMSTNGKAAIRTGTIGFAVAAMTIIFLGVLAYEATDALLAGYPTLNGVLGVAIIGFGALQLVRAGFAAVLVSGTTYAQGRIQVTARDPRKLFP